VCDNAGNNQSAGPGEISTTVQCANIFYETWANGGVIISQNAHINDSAMLFVDNVSESDQFFADHHISDGAINVYWVSGIAAAMHAGAFQSNYDSNYCEYIDNNTNNSYIIMGPNAEGASLAHELGHAIGLFDDLYQDYGGPCNHEWDCGPGTNGYCNVADVSIPPLYNIMDAYAGSVENCFISITDSQMTTPNVDSQLENICKFENIYPNAFYKP
jgi:hypothetical protein